MPTLLPPAQVQEAPAPFRGLYGWGYLGPEGEGQGTLAVLVEPATGKVVLELHGLGERLVLLSGDTATGYRVQVPRQQVDTTAPTLGALPLPFLPQVASPEALLALLREGKGPGVRITKAGSPVPLKLHYRGTDLRGREEQVWLTWKKP